MEDDNPVDVTVASILAHLQAASSRDEQADKLYGLARTQPLGSDVDWEKEKANTFAIRMDMYWQLKFARQARSIDEAEKYAEWQ